MKAMSQSNGRIPKHAEWQSITARAAKPADSLPEAGRLIGNDLRSLATHVEGAGSEMERFVTEQVRERPYAVLVAAAGVGFLLGGGLRSRLTPLLFGVATRLVTEMAASASLGERPRNDPRGAASRGDQVRDPDADVATDEPSTADVA
jgi:hypothetical protein